MFRNKLKKQAFYLITLLAVLGAQSVFAQTADFTYQGKLNDGGNPANAIYDMQFRLFDLAGAGQGTQQGATITNPTVTVTNGNFAVSLDFGAAVFASGADRFLEISLRPAGNMGGYTSLAPRQKLTSAPYSIRSKESTTADALSNTCIGCVQDSNIDSLDGSKVTGTVASAATATTADNVTGVVAIENGGTGSMTQNFVDVSTNQTDIGGNKNFTGTISGNGAGLTNVVNIFPFSGQILFNSLPGGSTVYVFAGPFQVITLNAGQRLTGSATAPLSRSVANSSLVATGLCYQVVPGGSVINFTGNNSNLVQVGTTLQSFSANASVVPGAGTFNVGFCVKNSSTSAIDNSFSFVNGWIMVTNN